MLRQVCFAALTALALMAAPITAIAEENSTAYAEAKEKNHGHVGIHQRREAYREYIAGDKSSAPAPTPATIEPAAGDSKETGEVSIQNRQNARAQITPEYNQ